MNAESRQTITYEHVFANTSNCVIATDRRGRVVLVNREARDALGGGSMHAAPDQPELVPPLNDLIAKCLTTAAAQIGQHLEWDGKQFVVNATPIDGHGRVLGTVINFQPLHQFEISAKKLRFFTQLNKQLETIIASSSDGLWVCDGEGRIISINRASEKLNDIRAADYVGKKMNAVVTDGFMDRSVTLEVIKTKQKVSLIQHVHATGKELLVTGTPAFDSRGNIDLVVVNERDMTELNKLNRALDQANEKGARYRERINELAQIASSSRGLIAESEKMRRILQSALKLCSHDVSNILILGESGVGKGALAKYIHKHSRHDKNAFIHINCASLPETLLEAELFGYEKGAFTGASKEGKAGLFELAEDGTLFLDEIGDMPVSTQAKLLKYLDDGEIWRIGATRPVTIGCTILAASNQDLAVLVKRKCFRSDLYHRLNAFKLTIPPLRERPEDILELIQHYLKKYNVAYQSKKWIGVNGFDRLQGYAFPGNVRELKNILKKAIVLGDEDRLDGLIEKILKEENVVCSDASEDAAADDTGQPLKKRLMNVERQILTEALRRKKTSRKIARSLGISQASVMRKLQVHGLTLQSNRK